MTECFYNKNYLIYSDGRVYCKGTDKYHPPRFINGYINRGYITFNMGKKHYLANRLVAIHYIPNPNNLPFVDHKDGNKLNNDVSNLRWVTPIQNSNGYVGIRSDNISGFKNISWDKSRNKWIFQKVIYKKSYIKRHDNLNELHWFKFALLLTQRR